MSKEFPLGVLCVFAVYIYFLCNLYGDYSGSPLRHWQRQLSVYSPQFAIAPQQRQLLSFSPFLRQCGGASRLCCHPLRHKSRNSAPFSLLPAAPFGDNFALLVTSISRLCVTLFSSIFCIYLLLSTFYFQLVYVSGRSFKNNTVSPALKLF
jgi:hypothetical protein